MSDDDNDAALAAQQENEQEQSMSLHQRLAEIQRTLNAPKGQFNKFGGYKYRSCEDILMAVKPLLRGLSLVIEDDIVLIGERFYVKATATLTDGETSVHASAYAREAATKKGMDESQITGATSSYARKYALNGLLLIDDNKDADATNDHDKRGVIKATDEAVNGMDDTQRLAAERIASVIKSKFHDGNEYGAYEEYVSIEDQELRIAIWGLLGGESKVRSTLKRMAKEEKESEHA